MSQAYYTYRICIETYDQVRVEQRDPQNELIQEGRGDFRYKDSLREQINALAIATYNNELKGSNGVKEFGEALFSALFDNVLRYDFINLYNRVIHKEQKLLRIELDINERNMFEVAALPWEFMKVPEDVNLGVVWLGTTPNLIFSRRRAQWHLPQPIQLKENEKLKIALIVSTPKDLEPVAYEKVEEDLKEFAVQQKNRIELLPMIKHATPEEIDNLLAQRPHIFHFIGHGRLHNEEKIEVGQIGLTKETGRVRWVDADYFSELLNQHRPGVVMLQACEGGKLSASRAFVGVASRVVEQNIPVVVAMQYEVTNSTASRFACHFYQRLAQDYPVDKAIQDGRRHITFGLAQYNTRDFATPVVFMRVPDGHLFRRSITETVSSEATTVSYSKLITPIVQRRKQAEDWKQLHVDIQNISFNLLMISKCVLPSDPDITWKDLKMLWKPICASPLKSFINLEKLPDRVVRHRTFPLT